jgi:NADPH:quinone reductase-like Zn-dependent oxidoreductase
MVTTGGRDDAERLGEALVVERLREAVLPLFAAGRVTVPVHQTFPLERAPEAYEAFARPGKFGKLVLLP